MTPQPPFISVDQLPGQMRQQGYAVLDPQGVCQFADCHLDGLLALGPSWNDLPPDNYLKDGGHYRRRRHSSFIVEGEAITQAPHRAHWQSLEYNALHGGMQRWFEPVDPAVVSSRGWQQLLRGIGRVSSQAR